MSTPETLALLPLVSAGLVLLAIAAGVAAECRLCGMQRQVVARFRRVEERLKHRPRR